MLDKSDRVDAEELAFGIQFTAQFPGGKALAFTTAMPQQCSDVELRDIIARMAKASDHLDHIYLIRQLRKEREDYLKTIRLQQEQQANYWLSQEAEWQARGRQGPFQPTTSQVKQAANYDTTVEDATRRISLIDKQIAEVEASMRG